jgi:hypothetical protein
LLIFTTFWLLRDAVTHFEKSKASLWACPNALPEFDSSLDPSTSSLTLEVIATVNPLGFTGLAYAFF